MTRTVKYLISYKALFYRAKIIDENQNKDVSIKQNAFNIGGIQ